MDNSTENCGQLMRTLARIQKDPHPPIPWRDGSQLPWHETGFSEKMLPIHLDQHTHMASRTLEIITRHIDWLCLQMSAADLPAKGARVLDVGCGPGLYCHELARRGHVGLGFDYAPAPLRHARQQAETDKLDCEFFLADLTALQDSGIPDLTPVDVITLWFGEWHSFPENIVRDFLPRLAALLRPGGLFILEYQHWDSYPREDISEWEASESSPFHPKPHLWLQEYHWDDDLQSEINVHWIIDAETGEHQRYAQCSRAWRDQELAQLLADCGFSDPILLPPITGCDEQFEFNMLTARRL